MSFVRDMNVREGDVRYTKDLFLSRVLSQRLFVDNLPRFMYGGCLRKIFNRCGGGDIFIPRKRRRRLYTRFCVVRFQEEAEANYAIISFNGVGQW